MQNFFYGLDTQEKTQTILYKKFKPWITTLRLRNLLHIKAHEKKLYSCHTKLRYINAKHCINQDSLKYSHRFQLHTSKSLLILILR